MHDSSAPPSAFVVRQDLLDGTSRPHDVQTILAPTVVPMALAGAVHWRRGRQVHAVVAWARAAGVPVVIWG